MVVDSLLELKISTKIWGLWGTLIFAKLLTEQGVGLCRGSLGGLDCRSFAPQSRYSGLLSGSCQVMEGS